MADRKPSWEYKPGTGSDTAVLDESENELPLPKGRSGGSITWEASEYVQHQRGPGWYALLIILTVVVTAAVYFITSHDLIATVIIPVLGIIVAAFSIGKPKDLSYKLDGSGITIGGKFYTYNHFKSFSIIHDGALNSINLMPIKKFMPPISAYYAPGDEEKILDILGQHLPYEERQMDPVDRLTRRLRF